VSAAVSGTGISVTLTASLPSPQVVGTAVTFSAECQGATGFQYRFWVWSGGTVKVVQDWGAAPTWTLPSATPAGTATVQVDIRSRDIREAYTKLPFVIANAPATSVNLTANLSSPQLTGTPVTFTAMGAGSAAYRYRFWVWSGTTATIVQDWSTTATWTLPGSASAGTYTVQVDVRTNETVLRDAFAKLAYTIANPPAAAVSLTANLPAPQPIDTEITFTAAGVGSTGYEYRFWLWSDGVAVVVQDWSVASTWTMPAGTEPGAYTIQADVRTNSFGLRDSYTKMAYVVSIRSP
jgi:hypothetical protein